MTYFLPVRDIRFGCWHNSEACNFTWLFRQYAGYDYSHQGRFVAADMMQPQQPYTGQIFQPTQAYTPTTPQPFYGNNFEDEPPLLEGTVGYNS